MPAPKDPEKREEWLRKLSENARNQPNAPFVKGRTPWNKGVPMTKEAKAKFQSPTKGKKHSDEARARMAESQKRRRASSPSIGVKPSDETKARMSASHKARYANGYTMSEEARKSVGDKHRGVVFSTEARAKIGAANRVKPGRRTGIPQPPETVKRMSEISRRQWENMTEEQKAANTARLREASRDIKISHLEEIVAAELDEQGIIYERQKKIGWYVVDFYIPAENRVIEANGCYWHHCIECGQGRGDSVEKRLKDAKRYAYLLRKGYTLQIIWEHERKSKLYRFRTKNGGG